MDCAKTQAMTYSFKKVFLIILDGFGLAPPGPGNPISAKTMPYLNSLMESYAAFNVLASGLVVGLPWGKPGNSEVGHSAIGTGRIIIQDWARINADIISGEFFKNKALTDAAEHCRAKNSTLHLIGCTSPGGIHGHEDHLIALLEFASLEQLASVAVHMIADGEDSGPTESLATLGRLAQSLEKSHAKIATVAGRMYAMDRVFNWNLTEQTWRAIVEGTGGKIDDGSAYLKKSHASDMPDDQIVPAVVQVDGKPVATVREGDAVIFFNYRNDRMKQMVAPFVTPDFKGFAPRALPKDLFVVSMTRYSNDLAVNAVAYEAPDIHHTLGKEISRRELKQFRVAEKEKEAHVSNFFNGGRIDPYEGTEQVIVSSRQLTGAEYLKYPEMSAQKIADELLARTEKDFTLSIANFANCDMMAHTGNMEAVAKGIAVVDGCLKQIITKVLEDPSAA